ncbi:hypothetical protein [Rhodococcus sp. T7]|uniref:hypothetical protein n=1 Tax=Rhodococcus sp. T7 TaxID=627444 RepID=UPI00135A4B3A|nr:hypothetical protein [Rhodococcus sp. T7]
MQAPEVVARNINSGGRNTVDGREVKMTRAFGGKKSKNVLDALNLDGAVERVDVDRDTWNTISIGDSYPQ